MTIRDAIRERLLDLSPVTALVGQRVYPLVVPQNERRAVIRLQTVSDVEDQHLRGPASIITTRLQADVYVTVLGSSDPVSEVEAIGAAIHGDGLGTAATGLFGFIGDLGGRRAMIKKMNIRLALRRGPFYEHDNEVVRVGLQQDYWIDWKALN